MTDGACCLCRKSSSASLRALRGVPPLFDILSVVTFGLQPSRCTFFSSLWRGDICHWLLAPCNNKPAPFSVRCWGAKKNKKKKHLCSGWCMPWERKAQRTKQTSKNGESTVRCKEWTGNLKEMFHGVLLCSAAAKTPHRRRPHSPPSVFAVCDAGIVHLHPAEPLTEQIGEGGGWKQWKCQGNMILAAPGGNKLL